MGHDRTDDQGRVGHPAADHDVGPGLQGRRNRLGADVGVSTDQFLCGHALGQGFGQQRAVRGAAQVIAVHHGNPRRARAQGLGQAVDGAGRGLRVGGAEVADDADAVLQAVGQHRAQKLGHQRFEPGLGVAAPGQLGQGQGAFRQGLEDQHRRLTLADQLLHDGAGGIDAVPGEARGAADQ